MVMSKRRQVGIVSDHFIRQLWRRDFPVPAARSKCAMTVRIRHCVECPKCLTRYLVGFSPFRNGSHLVPLAEGFREEWTLYCSCGRPPTSSRWRWSELKMYVVSNKAYELGYGQPEEIVPVGRRARFSG